MKAKELAALGEEELKKKISELKTDLVKLNTQVATGTTPKSPGLIKKFRKTIARINMIMHMRRIESAAHSNPVKSSKLSSPSKQKAASNSLNHKKRLNSQKEGGRQKA